MPSTGKLGWGLRRPLQIESLRRKLPESDQTEALLKRLQRLRENLDAVVYALSSHELAEDRREHLQKMLERHRGAFEACLAELGLGEPDKRDDPLWHFRQLDEATRTHLVAILDVPEEQPFYPVLDIKAQEYLAQIAAFEAITEVDGFRERKRLGRATRRGVVVLTLSGSLVQLSAPTTTGGRRYLYQNIYGNVHPPQGVLVLDREIRLGHRIRSVELTTSPIRLLRVASRRMTWKEQIRTFERLARTLTTLASRSSTDASGAPMHNSRSKAQAAERVLREEYAEDLERIETLRAALSGDDAERVEAELLTACILLQTGARELGFEAQPIDQLTELCTGQGERYAYDAKRQTLTRLPNERCPELVYPLVSVGRQMVTCGAPLALIGQDGRLIELLPTIAEFRSRK